MSLETKINEKIQRLQDLNREMKALNDQIGALQEKGRAYHQQALQVKGALDELAQLKAEEDEAQKNSKTAGLILPEGVKPVVETAAPAAEAPKSNTPNFEVVK